MAKNEQTYVLVQMTGDDLTQGPLVKSLIRTYYSEDRAGEDRDLLVEMNPGGTYLVLTIQHIDN